MDGPLIGMWIEAGIEVALGVGFLGGLCYELGKGLIEWINTW